MSERYPGGLITKTPVEPSGPYQNSTASGVWTVDQAAQYAKAGNWPTAGNLPNFIEDVFSTYLYTGNGSTQTITNGIDLATKGGLVWAKDRQAARDNYLFDTVRGGTSTLISNKADAAATNTVNPPITSFSSTGYTYGQGLANWNAETHVSWTFRKQPKFFDVVTYTGNGTTRAISHSLGSTPGFIVVKSTSTADNWFVYHRSLNDNSGNPYFLKLNSTASQDTGGGAFGTPTSTTFTVRNGSTNTNGATYVAYLFAHDAGGFGLSGTDNVISCGSWTGSNQTITLGWEPQYILWKRTDNTGDWYVVDNMRGMPVTASDKTLYPNLSNAESTEYVIDPTATGFIHNSGASGTYIYIAIRRGPMKVPTSGTSVFSPASFLGTGSYPITVNSLNAADVAIIKEQTSGGSGNVYDRLRAARLFTDLSNAEFVSSGWALGQSGVTIGNAVNDLSKYYATWLFRRAPGFFDVVCDTGTGSAHTITHNLGAVPELMIRKKRSAADNWIVYANNDPTDYLILNSTAATADLDTMWNDTAPTSTVFTVGTNDDVNQNTGTFVTYLFATVAGVSKVGSYTGTGTTKQIDCGFTGGARFVMIKRTDSTGDWYVWDSARGIVAGNDPYLLLNSTAAEVASTDYVDTYSAGFEISSTAPAAINANGGSFIFLAIA